MEDTSSRPLPEVAPRSNAEDKPTEEAMEVVSPARLPQSGGASEPEVSATAAASSTPPVIDIDNKVRPTTSTANHNDASIATISHSAR